MKCIISCEHASRRLPSRFAELFRGRGEVLRSHRAYDRGAAGLAKKLAGLLGVSLHLGTVSRLLIDLNRSPSNKRSLFSEYTRKLHRDERQQILKRYYFPYRERVEGEISAVTAGGSPVLHVSVHSFSPVLKGRERRADIGLLYDPARNFEKTISRIFAESLRKNAEHIRVRKNYPYLGRSDGFTSFLRKRFSQEIYAGIEIEVNQALLGKDPGKKREIEQAFASGIGDLLALQNFSALENA